MSIFADASTKVVVQGLTGNQGRFHGLRNRAYGTRVVAGVTPGKGGADVDGIPVFNTVAEAVAETGADASLVFVPPRAAPPALLEAAEAGVRLIVCITEGIPVHDELRVVNQIARHHPETVLIGPNCPGIISPGRCNIGITPTEIALPPGPSGQERGAGPSGQERGAGPSGQERAAGPNGQERAAGPNGQERAAGPVGIVSRSGTLTYQALQELTRHGVGQTTCIGIGGDPIPGTGFIDCLRRFEDDPETRAVVLIGEIGGTDEEDAAAYIGSSMTKPVVAYVAGITAPPGRRMGHAGAIVSGRAGTAQAKVDALLAGGAHVVEDPTELGARMAQVLAQAAGSGDLGGA